MVTANDSSSNDHSEASRTEAGIRKILITGGSGLIGRHLTQFLRGKGYAVSHLGRGGNRTSGVSTFVWDPAANIMDERAVEGVDAIIHLAGSGVADKRWNKKVKHEIVTSRTDTARLLREAIAKVPTHQVKVFVSSSGINYYGLDDHHGEGFAEADPPGDDFMARVCVAWENEVRAVEDLGIRTVMLRTGMVLTPKGGALQKLVAPVRLFAGAPLGSGRQMINWIHIDDLCRLYAKSIEDNRMIGVYNAVAPGPVTNAEFTRAIAGVLKRPLWLPAVPGFAVHLLVGELAEIVLQGGAVSAQKLQVAGFKFRFRNVSSALQDLLIAR